MGDLSILVVDDESRMRKLIKDFLMQKNYNILEAEDGEKALKVYEENKEKISTWSTCFDLSCICSNSNIS